MPRTLSPTKMKPNHVTQKMERLSSSVIDRKVRHSKNTGSPGLLRYSIKFREAQKCSQDVLEHECYKKPDHNNDQHHQETRKEFSKHVD